MLCYLCVWGGPFSSSQDYTQECILWDEGCLSQHSRWQVSALVKAGFVIISLLLVYMLVEQRCTFLFLHDDDVLKYCCFSNSTEWFFTLWQSCKTCKTDQVQLLLLSPVFSSATLMADCFYKQKASCHRLKGIKYCVAVNGHCQVS